VPFSVWVDALDAYVASQEIDAGGTWDADLVGELARILPAVAATAAGDGNGGAALEGVADERYRAHRAMRALLEELARTRPLVLVLDDLQWSDGASTELIGALLRRRGPQAGVLLAVAFRPGQAPEQLRAALAVPTAERLLLAPLDDAQAVALLDGAAGAADIVREAAGNPFYLEQLARARGDGSGAGGAARAPARDGEPVVPAAVEASIAEELAALAPAERALLMGAAVAGEPFEPDVAAAVAEQSTGEALTALDALLERDLLRATAVPRRFVFRHPLVRAAVYRSAPGGWRLAAHARAASVLAAHGAAVTERAHHVEQAAAQGDEDAIALLTSAGDAAAARAPSAAVRWYDAVLRLLPADDAERQVEVRMALSGSLRSLGELERCRKTIVETLELLAPGDDERRLELTSRCAAVEHWLGRHEEAHKRLFRAWQEQAGQSAAAAAGLQIELAVDGMYTMNFQQTLSMGRSALDIAREAGDATLLAGALAAVCLGEAAAGEIEAARVHHAEASAAIDRLSDAELAPRLESLSYLAWAENYLEGYADAIAHADRGIAIGRATGAGQLLVPMMLVKGYPLEMQGRLAAAVEVCESAVEAARLSAGPHYLFWALFELAFARYYTGDLAEAIAAGEESARVGGRLTGGTMPAGGGGPGWPVAMARFEAGEVERAWKEMRALGPDDLPHKVPVERCFDWEVLALVALARGRPEEAEGYVARAEESAARFGLQLPLAISRRARAAVLLASGDAAGAADVAASSVAAAESIGAVIVACFARELQGRALAEAGDRAGAVAALRAAEAELDRCGALRGRDQARRELRKLGARAEKRGPAAGGDSGVASLTKREREIADLVCDRRTNREIAATLFLSDKTIESHLRNIFVKLGVSSRVDVARAVEREPAA
jgi:DNA-binding CsgD family transcriptional regulator